MTMKTKPKKKPKKPRVKWLDWHGCYDDGWKGLIVDAAFAHPAKAARGLVRRIFAHMESQGWLPPRSRILDVFGGIGTTAIEGASRGHEVVCIELEEKFYNFALENFQLHRRVWEVSGDPLPVMLHGDSRKAVEIVGGYFKLKRVVEKLRDEGKIDATVGSPPFGERRDGQGIAIDGETTCGRPLGRSILADAAIGSPPYSNDRIVDRNGIDRSKMADGKPGGPNSQAAARGYGGTDGQLGEMAEGGLDAAISSPPYAETVIDPQGNFQSTKCPNSKPARDVRGEGYDGVVGSPPYADSVNSEQHGIDWTKAGPATGNRKRGEGCKHEETLNSQLSYGSVDGQLGAMKEGDVDAAVSSPPYEGIRQDGGGEYAKEGRGGFGNYSGEAHDAWHTTRDPANLGNLGSETNVDRETFWAAARTILEQVYQLLKPGGHCAWIVKDYVKAGKRVPFCDNWARLCEAVGFKVVQRVRCHLVKEETNPGLFGKVTKRTERKSFFRRLHERKPGAVRIDWEEVLFVVRPA